MAVVLCLVFLLQGSLLFHFSESSVNIAGSSLEQYVRLGERNVSFWCVNSYWNAEFKWCYDPDCNSSVAQCLDNVCSKAVNVCSCSSVRDRNITFGSVSSAMINRPYYCVQEQPINKRKGYQFKKVILHPKTGVEISIPDTQNKNFKMNLDERNVSITCKGTSVWAELVWCYNVNCSRPVADCSHSWLGHSIDVCSRKERDVVSLKFGPITAEMANRQYFCQQRMPLIENASSSFVLKVQKTGITILGRKLRTVKLGEKDVHFNCKSHYTHKVRWCYDDVCAQPVSLCPSNNCSTVKDICYCSSSRIIKLSFPQITRKMLGSYHCVGVSPSKTIANKTVQLQIIENPPTSTLVPSPSPTFIASLQNDPLPSSHVITRSQTSAPLFQSKQSTPSLSTSSTRPTISRQSTLATTLQISESQSVSWVNPTAAVGGASGVVLAALLVVLIVTCRSRLRIGKWSLHLGESSPKYEKHWEIRRSKLKIGNRIGDGYFGSVFKAETVGEIKGWTKREVAVKMVNDKHPVDGIMSLADEVKLLKKIKRHENIIALIGTCVENGPLWMVIEYAEHGSLLCYLRSLRPSGMLDSHILKPSAPLDTKQIISEETVWNFALQIVQGMKHLLSHKCIHRDLAARNVLVCKGQQLKICDFGMAKDIHYMEYYRRISPGILPLKWTAPESAVDKVFTEYSDVWSFGIVLWEITTLGASPYPGIEIQQLIGLLTDDGYRMSCPPLCPLPLYALMERCWNGVPENRPTFQVIHDEMKGLINRVTSV